MTNVSVGQSENTVVDSERLISFEETMERLSREDPATVFTIALSILPPPDEPNNRLRFSKSWVVAERWC